MACKGFWECLLKLLNLLLMVVGLAMIGYGIYLFVEYKNAGSSDDDAPLPPSSEEILQLGRPMLLTVSLNDGIFDKLPKAWNDYVDLIAGLYIFSLALVWLFFSLLVAVALELLHGMGAAWLFSGFLKMVKFSVLVILLILVELGLAAFIFFDKSWKEEIPTDKTGNFDMIYEFLEGHWKIIKWVALGAVILEALVFLLALVVRAANRPADYDSDEEYIGGPRQQIRQPLINRPAVPATGVPVAGTLDQRPSRNDAWSTRMREKYGLDTSEFTYNPSESNRFSWLIEFGQDGLLLQALGANLCLADADSDQFRLLPAQVVIQ
ncbi:hypothetical protein DH2020_020286 [Rehmannia glutinosa]|uniref:Tobamovirus multiplication protein 2A n=1 Tax=Rehmannia glutinosa TaxID=99300 RepID=A0ABR0WFT8_REHGL